MEVEVETDNRTSPGPDPPTNTSSPHPPPQSSDHAQPPPSDAESIHEYERIGLLSNAVQNASLASEQDNGSSRGSSLLQT